MKKYNVSRPKKYLTNGVEKTKWDSVGTLTEFEKPDGSVSRLLEIPAIGLEARVFPFNDASVADEQIDISDIPF